MCFWIWFASTLLRIFVSIYQEYWPLIFFSCNVFNWLLYEGNAGLIKWVQEFFSSSIFLKYLKRMGINFFLQVLENSHVKLSCLEFSLLGYIFHHCFNLLPCNWPVLIFYYFMIQFCMFVGIFPFLLRCPILWCIFLIVVPSNPLYFGDISCNVFISSLSFTVLCIWVLISLG